MYVSCKLCVNEYPNAAPDSPLCNDGHITGLVSLSLARTLSFSYVLSLGPHKLSSAFLCSLSLSLLKAAKWMLYATVAQVTPAVVVATAMGALSDRYGRKSSLVLAASAGLVEAAVIVAVSAEETE